MATGTDSDVALPTNQGGPLVDTSQVTTSAGQVQRQRVAIGDPSAPASLAAVTVEGMLAVVVKQQDETLLQLKRIARLLEILADEEVSVDEID